MKSQSRFLVVLALLPLLACTAVQQQKQAAAIKADNLEFHNLKVFPQNISHDDLINAMRFFTRSLGVRCGHCHVANPAGTKPEFDFPSDAKPEKETARVMMRMTTAINGDWVSKVAEHDTKVTCMTCHRGKVVPNDFDPAPAVPKPAAGTAAPAPAPTPQP
ncbi:MAG TPA: c-type cytochrome [Thermoanaerobaculia bacterium]|nr:c-type cytochrome [Thermoanaerobaculia bacterium]